MRSLPLPLPSPSVFTPFGWNPTPSGGKDRRELLPVVGAPNPVGLAPSERSLDLDIPAGRGVPTEGNIEIQGARDSRGEPK